MKKWRSGEDERKCGLNLVKFLSVCLVLSLLFWVFVVLTGLPSDGLWAVVQVRNLYFKLQKAILEENDVTEVAKDKLLGGLLPTGFDEESCVSRYQLPLYWRGVARKPSPHLISMLRSYEARHKRCGPHTTSYNHTLLLLQSHTPFSDNSTTLDLDCKYIMWVALEGLGNMMLSLASAFLYALLTDRVLLADTGVDIPHLFCEPFPEASLFLPTDFPFTNHFTTFNQQSNQSYGNLLKTNSSTLQPYIYLHLVHDYDHHDKLFFCDRHQTDHLNNIPWLIMKSDLYFVPSLFLMPSFQQELHTLFPEKDTVFHLLGRYLFHPTNSVWGLITRYHQAYLSQADVKVGIQVRVFDDTGPFTDEQILSCTMRENILPQISQSPSNTTTTTNTNTTRVGVVIASLRSGYMERVREMYWENPTERGEVVSVSQPSHEEHQQTEKPNHNRKALAEMYLLSLTDKLVTSGWSTFGYVAQSLAGVKPWILYRPQNRTVPEPPCGRGMSMEPCCHFPHYYDCKIRAGVDPGGVVPHVRHCEDVSWGLKLV